MTNNNQFLNSSSRHLLNSLTLALLVGGLIPLPSLGATDIDSIALHVATEALVREEFDAIPQGNEWIDGYQEEAAVQKRGNAGLSLWQNRIDFKPGQIVYLLVRTEEAQEAHYQVRQPTKSIHGETYLYRLRSAVVKGFVDTSNGRELILKNGEIIPAVFVINDPSKIQSDVDLKVGQRVFGTDGKDITRLVGITAKNHLIFESKWRSYNSGGLGAWGFLPVWEFAQWSNHRSLMITTPEKILTSRHNKNRFFEPLGIAQAIVGFCHRIFH